MAEINRKISKVMAGHLILLGLVATAGFWGYSRYWNIAVVNGRGISRLAYINNMERQGGKQVLEMMIQETLILGEAMNKGIKIEQKAIDEEIAKIETRIKASGQTLETALISAGMTKGDLEKQIQLKKIEEALSAPKLEITQAQIDEFLKTNKSQLPTGKTKEELQALAKDELISQANQASASAWLENLRQSAKIVTY